MFKGELNFGTSGLGRFAPPSPEPATSQVKDVDQPTQPTSAGGGGGEQRTEEEGGGRGGRTRNTEEENEEEEEEVTELTKTWVERHGNKGMKGVRWWGVRWVNGEITYQLDENLPNTPEFLALRQKVFPRYNPLSRVPKIRSSKFTRRRNGIRHYSN